MDQCDTLLCVCRGWGVCFMQIIMASNSLCHKDPLHLPGTCHDFVQTRQAFHQLSYIYP